ADAFVDVGRGGRQADTGGPVPGFGHVGGQLADPFIDPVDGTRDGVEAFVGISKDFEYGHQWISTAGKLWRVKRVAVSGDARHNPLTLKKQYWARIRGIKRRIERSNP